MSSKFIFKFFFHSTFHFSSNIFPNFELPFHFYSVFREFNFFNANSNFTMLNPEEGPTHFNIRMCQCFALLPQIQTFKYPHINVLGLK